MIPSLMKWVKGSSIAAVTQNQSLAGERPYAAGVAMKRKGKERKKKRKKGREGEERREKRKEREKKKKTKS